MAGSQGSTLKIQIEGPTARNTHREAVLTGLDELGGDGHGLAVDVGRRAEVLALVQTRHGRDDERAVRQHLHVRLVQVHLLLARPRVHVPLDPVGEGHTRADSAKKCQKASRLAALRLHSSFKLRWVLGMNNARPPNTNAHTHHTHHTHTPHTHVHPHTHLFGTVFLCAHTHTHTHTHTPLLTWAQKQLVHTHTHTLLTWARGRRSPAHTHTHTHTHTHYSLGLGDAGRLAHELHRLLRLVVEQQFVLGTERASGDTRREAYCNENSRVSTARAEQGACVRVSVGVSLLPVWNLIDSSLRFSSWIWSKTLRCRAFHRACDACITSLCSSTSAASTQSHRPFGSHRDATHDVMRDAATLTWGTLTQ